MCKEKEYWNGYELPPARTEEDFKKPLVINSSEKIVMECWELPWEIVVVRKPREGETITNKNFVIEILGKSYGFVQVEFPILHAMSPEDNKVALVKLYRCKLEE